MVVSRLLGPFGIPVKFSGAVPVKLRGVGEMFDTFGDPNSQPMDLFGIHVP